MTTTQTAPDPATLDVHPLYVLINAAQAVSDAEVALQSAAKRVRERAESIEADLDRGRSVNSLGELQGAGPTLDVCCGRLELAASLLSSTHAYLGRNLDEARLVTDPDVRFAPSVINMVQWFDGIVAGSPRVRAIVGSRS